MNALPAQTLWVWERPEDLRSIDPRTTAIAPLDRTLVLGRTMSVIPHRQSYLYRLPTFATDLTEVALMFFCFYSLGLLEDTGIQPEDPLLAPAYSWLLIDVILVQFIWRLLAGVEVWTAWRSRLAVAIILIVGTVGGFFGAPEYPNLHPLIDFGVAFAMVGFVIRYVWKHDDFWREE